MISSPFRSGTFSFKARLLYSILLVTGIPFLLFLILGFLTGWHLSSQAMILVLLLFFASTTGLAILLYQKIMAPLGKFFQKVRETHHHSFARNMAVSGLSFLNRYADETDARLKARESEISRVRSRVVALSAITATTSQDSEVDQILNESLGVILEVTGFDGGIMFLRCGEEENWDVRAWKGLPLDDVWGAERVEVGQGVLGEAARRQRIIFVSDVEENQTWQIQEFKDRGIRTVLVVPFVTKRKVLGAALLVSVKPRETNLEENELLETIGRQLGMAISSLNLQAGWTARARNLCLLLEACSAFCASLSTGQISKVLTRKMLEFLEADFCYAALVDEDRTRLVFQAFSSAQRTVSPIKPDEKIDLRQLPLCHEVIRTDKMVRIRGRGQLTSSERQLLPKGEASEVILIPLSKGDEAVGLMGVGLSSPERLDSENLDLARSIAGQAAVALVNARLYQKVKEKAGQVSSLYHAAQKLSSILDPDKLLDESLKVVTESFGYPSSAILLVDQSKSRLFVKAACGFPDEAVRNSRIRVGEEGITGWVAHTGEPLVVGDVQKDSRYVMGIKECRSEVAVPLRLKGEIIGVLDAESDKPFAFGDNDMRLLSQLASLLAILLENSRVFSSQRRRSAQLALVNDVAKKVVSALNLDELLENVTRAIQSNFKYDHVSLFLLDEPTGDFVLRTSYGSFRHAVKPGCRLRNGVGMVGRTADSGKTNLCQDVTAETEYIPAIPDTRSELCVPVSKGKIVVGVLDIQSFAKNSFDEQDVTVMETVTDLLATAVSNAQLYEESGRKARRLELADQISRTISSTLDVKEVFDAVSRELNRVLDFDRISLSYWYPEEQLFRLEMSFSPDAGLSAVGSKRIPAGETNMSEVIRTGKTFYQAKLSMESAAKPMDQLIFSEGIRSYAYVPVADNQGVMAVLGLEAGRKNAFSAHQTELLESVAVHLSLAIRNARLFSDLEKAYRNLKKGQRDMIQTERFRALGEMAGGVVHDFNNILASILGRVQLILMKLRKSDGPRPEEMEKGLQVIERLATDGARILDRIREFTKAKPESAFGFTDLNQVIDDSLELTKAYWKDKATAAGTPIEVKRELNAESGVMGDGAELREAVTNLILNALDAMPNGGTLTLKTEEDDSSARLSVKDTGVGMPEDVKEKIFAPFFTTKGEQGTGLGLSLVKGIITRHRGDISVETSRESGSSFKIRLPKCDLRTEPEAPDSNECEGASVLVVEDEENIREVLDEILSNAGHRIIQAASGEEGIELFERHKPDMVITDLGMPGVSGWDVADAVKATDPSTPVVLFTGWGVKMDQNEVQKRSVDRFVNKPFNMEQILKLVSELLAEKKTKSVDVTK
jgi:GAF domain-containing protein/CheY-like chemotaxis protein/anti-sigma regulatory factor (Ser/Thr protein kinase)